MGARRLVLKFKLPVREDRLLRWSSFVLSLGLHVAFGALLLAFPTGTDHRPVAVASGYLSLRERRPESRRIIWLRRDDRLPSVNSGEDRKPKMPKSRKEAPHIVFTSPKPRARHKQFIFVEPPTVTSQPPMPSPNLLVLGGLPADIAPPAPRPVAKRFQLPEPKPRSAPNPIDLTEGLPDVGNGARLEIPVPTPSVDVMYPTLPRPPAKKFVLPGDATKGAGGGQTSMIDPPALSSDGSASTIDMGGTGPYTLAVISAQPSNIPVPPVPRGNRPDAIRLNGVPGGTSNGGEGGKGGATVPGLTVRGKAGETGASGAAAPNSKPSEAPALVPTRPPQLPPFGNTPTVSVPQWPNARRVPAVVEEAFRGRPVFATVLTPPNGLPDWVLWFGDSTPSVPGTRIFMRPPLPRQVSWTANSNGWPGRLWVRAHLTKEGSLESITLAQGGDVPVAGAIVQILSRWRFIPAVRNGETVDSDVLFEMTFERGR